MNTKINEIKTAIEERLLTVLKKKEALLPHETEDVKNLAETLVVLENIYRVNGNFGFA